MALHHQPWKQVQAAAQDLLPLLLCVRIGNSFSQALGLGDADLGSLEVIPKTLARFLGLQKETLDGLLAEIAGEVTELGRAYGLSGKAFNASGTPDRKRPQRRGFYVCEDPAELDPVWCFLETRGAAAGMATEIARWLNAPEDLWCWVRATTPGFVQGILSDVPSASANTGRGVENLLLLLPEGAQGGLQRELAQAGLPFLIEPWPTAALCETLHRMGGI